MFEHTVIDSHIYLGKHVTEQFSYSMPQSEFYENITSHDRLSSWYLHMISFHFMTQYLDLCLTGFICKELFFKQYLFFLWYTNK